MRFLSFFFCSLYKLWYFEIKLKGVIKNGLLLVIEWIFGFLYGKWFV